MVCIAEGQYLFRQGETGDVAYLIEWGQVEVVVDEPFGSRRIATLGPGELVGEMALVDGSPRSASVRTTETSTFLVITRDAIERRVKASDPVVSLIMGSVMDRLRAMTNGGTPAPADAAGSSVRREACAAVIAHFGLIHDFEAGLLDGAVTLAYQPIVRICDDRIIGYEALARWRHPRRGYISPSQFIPLAETNDLSATLACRCVEIARNDLPHIDATTLRLGGAPPVRLWINISGMDVAKPGFIDMLADRAGEAAHQITLELTETAFVEDPKVACTALIAARSRGFQIAIDDFGVGNASLQYLREFPIDVVKLDKSFLQSGINTSHSLEIMRSVIDLSTSLGLITVVEGIEDAGQLTSAKSLGANCVQGYLLGRPVSIDGLGTLAQHAAAQRHLA